MALSIGIRNSISLLSAIQATRLLTFTLVGLSPTEHTSSFFSWTRFRTAGFPHYGFKAGLSEGAFPARRPIIAPLWFASLLRAPRFQTCLSPLGVGAVVRWSAAIRADSLLYPRGPRSGPGYSVPVPLRLIDPIRPSCGHISTSPPCGLYEMPSLCMFSMPRRPTTGSELSLMIFRNMSSSVTTGNFPAALTQYYTGNTSLRHGLNVSAFPSPSHSDPSEE